MRVGGGQVAPEQAIDEGADRAARALLFRQDKGRDDAVGNAGRAEAHGNAQALQVFKHLLHGLIAVARFFRQRLIDDVGKFLRQFVVDLFGRLETVVNDRVHQVNVGLAFERQLAGRHLVEHDAERIDVAAMVGALALRLFGRHVIWRTKRRADAGQLVRFALDGALFIGKQLGQSEIENLGLAARCDDDVRGFDVAVDDAFGVRRGERVGDLQAD